MNIEKHSFKHNLIICKKIKQPLITGLNFAQRYKLSFWVVVSRFFSGTEHWLLKTYFHPLLWSSSGLGENWKPTHYMHSKLGWVNREVLGIGCPTACTCLFEVRPGVLSKTLSQMWGKLNFPIFLFNVGWLTLIKIDSLMFLAKPCPSLPPYHLKIVLTGGMACIVAMMMYARGFPLFYSSSQVRSPHWYKYVAPLLLTMGLCPWGRPVGSWWYYYL